MMKAHCNHFYIRSNRYPAFYDDMSILKEWRAETINGFELEQYSMTVENRIIRTCCSKRLPKYFMSKNAVYLLVTVLIRNFYKTIIRKINIKDF